MSPAKLSNQMEVNLQDDPGEKEIKNCLNGVEASRGPKKGKLNKS